VAVTPAEQRERVRRLLEVMSENGIDGVSSLSLLDALACAGFVLVENDVVAGSAFLGELLPAEDQP
jgi:hypothetical protein